MRTTIMVDDGVRASLLRGEAEDSVEFRVRPFHGGRVRPRVDLDDNASLLEATDQR